MWFCGWNLGGWLEKEVERVVWNNEQCSCSPHRRGQLGDQSASMTGKVKQLLPQTTAQYIVVVMLVFIASQLQGQGLDPSISSLTSRAVPEQIIRSWDNGFRCFNHSHSSNPNLPLQYSHRVFFISFFFSGGMAFTLDCLYILNPLLCTHLLLI